MPNNAISGIFRHVIMYVAASKFLEIRLKLHFGMFRGCL